MNLGNNIFTNRRILLQFSQYRYLLNDGMNTVLQLFRSRNTNAMSKTTNRLFRTSIFLDNQISKSIINETVDLSTIRTSVPDFMNVDITKIHRISLPYESLEGIWAVAITDLGLECIYYLSSWSPTNDPTILDSVEKVNKSINKMLSYWFGPRFSEWECVLYPYSHNYYISNEDSGIFIVTAIYFLVQECPIYIPEDALQDLRKIFSYWLIEGKLPIRIRFAGMTLSTRSEMSVK